MSSAFILPFAASLCQCKVCKKPINTRYIVILKGTSVKTALFCYHYAALFLGEICHKTKYLIPHHTVPTYSASVQLEKDLWHSIWVIDLHTKVSEAVVAAALRAAATSAKIICIPQWPGNNTMTRLLSQGHRVTAVQFLVEPTDFHCAFNCLVIALGVQPSSPFKI